MELAKPVVYDAKVTVVFMAGPAIKLELTQLGLQELHVGVSTGGVITFDESRLKMLQGIATLVLNMDNVNMIEIEEKPRTIITPHSSLLIPVK